jgi:hypothetical protein
MFTSRRYATRGVMSEIGIDIQFILWALIDKQKSKRLELDYLQIFELSIESKNEFHIQKIIHRQERPETKNIYYFPDISTPLNIKVWAIDSEEYCMMLLPDEY